MATTNSLVREYQQQGVNKKNAQQNYGAMGYFNNQAQLAQQNSLNALNAKYSQPSTNYVSQLYQQQANLANSYASQAQQFQNNYKANQQLQDLYRQEALKYIPTELAVQGQAGSGVSESTMAGINNAYAKNLNLNNIQYQQGLRDLYQNYQADKTNIDNSILNAQEDENTKLLNLMNQANSVDQLTQLYQNLNRNDNYTNQLYETLKNDLAYKEYGELLSSATTQEELDNLTKRYGNYNYSPVQQNYLDQVRRNAQEVADANYVLNNYSKYGVTTDSKVLDVTTATASDLKDGATGNSTGKQYKHVAERLEKAKNGEYQNGQIIDFNYGVGKNYYMYYNGKLYKLSNNDFTKASYKDWVKQNANKQ